ncbi:MAG: FAD-binding protein [Ruminococcaceae bacterium]|nr:FAD-binding protein [Oscillospiraceae bacterium]
MFYSNLIFIRDFSCKIECAVIKLEYECFGEIKMIRTEIKLDINYDIDSLKDAIVAHLPVDRSEIKEIRILKKTLCVTDKPSFSLSLGVEFSPEREEGLKKMKKKVSECPDYTMEIPKCDRMVSPVVVGAGPAGLFAALVLAEGGARPIVIERGEEVDKRARTTAEFFSRGVLSGESNIQYGEGGAGAFSDGKLKVGSMDKYKYKVLSEFVGAGAPEDIVYTVGAHLGTDKLPSYVKKIREKIISLGASFIFSARVKDIKVKNGCVCAVVYEKDGRDVTVDTDRVIFAAGHSAKDSFEMLMSLRVPMSSRPFGIGVRIEHRREYINSLVYGDKCKELEAAAGTASYHLVTHLPNGRSVYSFCMCPGGTVVAAASEEGGVVTNGMSECARMAENSNAAHLVSLTPADFGSEHPLAGIDLQRRIERAAYIAGGGNFRAPAISMESFMKNEAPSLSKSLRASYPCGVTAARAEDYLPDFVTDSLRPGIADFDKWMPGFYHPDALLTGAETRSTSPVRIHRNASFMSDAVKGLYPIGEGAGYAGGIVSSAVDGVRAAESILKENSLKCK